MNISPEILTGRTLGPLSWVAGILTMKLIFLVCPRPTARIFFTCSNRNTATLGHTPEQLVSTDAQLIIPGSSVCERLGRPRAGSSVLDLRFGSGDDALGESSRLPGSDRRKGERILRRSAIGNWTLPETASQETAPGRQYSAV